MAPLFGKIAQPVTARSTLPHGTAPAPRHRTRTTAPHPHNGTAPAPRHRTRTTAPHPHHGAPSLASRVPQGGSSRIAALLFIPALPARTARFSHGRAFSYNPHFFFSLVRDRVARNVGPFRTDGQFPDFFRESTYRCKIHDAWAPRHLAPSSPSSSLRKKRVDRVSLAQAQGRTARRPFGESLARTDTFLGVRPKVSDRVRLNVERPCFLAGSFDKSIR